MNKDKKNKLRKFLSRVSPEDKPDLLASELRDQIKEVESKIGPDLTQGIETLKSSLLALESNFSQEINKIRAEIPEIPEVEQFDPSELQKEIDTLEEGIKILRNRGGGSMNRQILVDGVNVLSKYTDINLVGTGGAIATTTDNTNKRVNIFLQSTAGDDLWTTTGVDGIKNTNTGFVQIGDVGAGGNYTYSYVASIGRNATNPLSALDPNFYTALVINPTVTQSTNTTSGVLGNAIDFTVAGNGNMGFVQGQFIAAIVNGTRTVDGIWGNQTSVTVGAGVTATDVYGLDLENGIGGSVTNNYHLKIRDAVAGTNNWNIYSGADISAFTAHMLSDGWFDASNVFASKNNVAGRGAVSFISQSNAASGVFGAFFIAEGTATNVSDIYGGFSDASFGGSGTADFVYGHFAEAGNQASGTTTNAIASYAGANYKAAGTITNSYGFYAAPQTVGTNNWNIYSGSASTASNDPYGYVGIARNAFITDTADQPSTESISQLNIMATNLVNGDVAGLVNMGGSYGNQNMTNLYGSYNFSVHRSSGTLTVANAGFYQVDGTGAGTIGFASGIAIESAVGTITDNRGLTINDQTAGSTNYSIYTGAGQLRFGDKITTYNAIATVSNGVPSELATVDLTGQTAAKGTTTLYTPTATGMFRITVYLQVTTAASVSSVLGGATGVVITYTDGDGSVAQTDTVGLFAPNGTVVTTLNTNTTATNLTGSIEIYAKTGVAIQYAIGYTSVGTAMQYAAHLKLEAM